MAQRVDPTKRRADGTPIEPLSIKHPNAAGIDIGGKSHYVAVPPDRVGKGESAVREFGTHTEDLVAIADWLGACRFDTVKHFCSWLGLCPGTRISGNKRLSGASKRIPNRVARALKLAAMGLSRSRCAMGAYYRRLALRMGSPKAITAVAHKLARIVYAMLSGQADYVKEDQVRHDARYRERAIKALQKRAQEFGLALSPQAVPAHA